MSYSAGDLKWGGPDLGTTGGTVTWSADISTGLVSVGSYSTSDYLSALQSAFDSWEEVANIDFTYVTGGSSDIDVVMGELSGSTVGLASYSYMPRVGVDEILSATITMDSLEIWSPEGGGGGLDWFAVALHEIGHVMGLGHVEDTSEIMNPYISRDLLGDGDIAGAQLLYGTPDGDSPPEVSGFEEPTDGDVAFEPSGGGDSGGAGGAAGLLLGLIGALIAMLFGGGGAVVAVAAAESGDDTGDLPDSFEDGHALTDFLPGIEVHEHAFYKTEADWLAAEDHHEDEELEFI